jgi:transposase
MNSYLGIDVSKDTLDWCLLREQEQHCGQASNAPTGYKALQKWLKQRKVKEVHICMEATGIYSLDVAQYLHEAGYRVSVVNPQRISGFAQSQMRRSKTDKLDAAVIAAFCRALQPEAWTPPEPAWFEFRALLRQLEDLQQTRQQQLNRLHSATSKVVRVQLEQLIAFLDTQIEQLKQQLRDHLKQHPSLRQQVELLKSIPGIGFLTACRLVGEIRSVTAFTDVRQLVAFVGLDPTRHDSGRSVRGSRAISRQGRAALRAALYMPALVAKKHNPVLRPFAQQLEARGKTSKQVTTAVMRKLLHLAYGILKSGQRFDPQHGQVVLLAA